MTKSHSKGRFDEKIELYDGAKFISMFIGGTSVSDS